MFQAELLVVVEHCVRQHFPDHWVSFSLTSQSRSEWFCVSHALPGRQTSKGRNAVSQRFRDDLLLSFMDEVNSLHFFPKGYQKLRLSV